LDVEQVNAGFEWQKMLTLILEFSFLNLIKSMLKSDLLKMENDSSPSANIITPNKKTSTPFDRRHWFSSDF
jgi:hypothetical protein